MKVSDLLKLSSFPEDKFTESAAGNRFGVSIFGETAMENQLALISHYFYNEKELSDSSRSQLSEYVREAIPVMFPDESDKFDKTLTLAENIRNLTLFDQLLSVPFSETPNPTFRYIDLFAGIGGIRIPFQELGGKCVFSSEWDKAAKTTYINNFGEIPFGDITKIPSSFIPDHDILLAGFPCQAFSIMGKMKGFEDTRGTLFFEVARILNERKPKAFLLENVKQLVSHDHGKTFSVILETLDNLGYSYKWKILNALDFGVPQKRERVIIVGFKEKRHCDAFDFIFENKPYDLKTILEDDAEADYNLFASEDIRRKRLARVEGKKIFYPSVWHENKSGNISILPYACALRTGASYNYLLINGIRRPSSRELLRFQGFPEKFEITVSHSEIRRQTGNSVAVPMIRAVAGKIVDILKYNNKNGQKA